jgi:hypothetical protein
MYVKVEFPCGFKIKFITLIADGDLTIPMICTMHGDKCKKLK